MVERLHSSDVGTEVGTALIAHPGAELYGSDRVMLETLAGLVERNWRVVLALPNDGPLVAAARTLGAEVVLLAVPVLRKSVLKPTVLPRFLGGSLAAAKRIDSLLKRLRPDVVYVSTLTVPLWIARAKTRKIPVLCHVHESERAAPTLLREAIAWPLMLADRVIANSAFSLESLTEVLPALAKRSSVLYNGVAAPPAITLPRADLDGGLHIVYVGRLSPRKGVDVAIEALHLLVRSEIDARLDIVGAVFTGYEWYETQLRDQVARLGLDDRVTFHGFQAAVWDTLADADVAVVPSRLEEPFGNTAVEAVLAGRPVVVSAIGGLAEAIDGFASALAVEPDDARDLVLAGRRPPLRPRHLPARDVARTRHACRRARHRHRARLMTALPPEDVTVPNENSAPLRVGYAAGAFDLFHIGHLNLLRHAKSQCDYLIAGVVSDEMLRQTKGIDPVIPLAERLEIVQHISYVDEARAEVVPDKLDTWRDVGFTHFFKGDDWRGTEKGLHLEEEFAKVGVEVVYFPYTMSTSSTVLRRALAALNTQGAERVNG